MDRPLTDFSVFTAGAFSFRVGESSGDTFSVTVGAMSTGLLGVNAADLSVASSASATAALTLVDTAINSISSSIAALGNKQVSLTFKEEHLNANMLTQESARSRIQDADFAKEQIEIVKLQNITANGYYGDSKCKPCPSADSFFVVNVKQQNVN